MSDRGTTAPAEFATASTVPADKAAGPSALKIWHLAENYPPYYGGGAAITTRDLCRQQALAGHEVRVLSILPDEEQPYTVRTVFDGAVRIDRILVPYFARANDPDGFHLGFARWREHEWKIARIIDQLLEEWWPDIVDYHSVRPLGEGCLIQLSNHGLPIVATLHDAWLICPRLMLLQSPNETPCSGPSAARCLMCVYSGYDGSNTRALVKMPWRVLRRGAFPAYRLAQRKQARSRIAAALARSEYMARVHRPHLGGTVRHVPLGIDLSGTPLPPVSRPHTPFRFGFMAGFQIHKGIRDLLHAVRELRREGHEFELHVWGPGSEEAPHLLAEFNLQEVARVRGMFTAETRWETYQQIDVALMATTVCEPFGRIVQEAAVASVPTITPDVGGITEQIRHGVNGLLYGFRKPQELLTQMRRILTEPDLLPTLTANLVLPPDARFTGSDVEAFYRDVLARRA